ncbi:MAG: hypothetical protein E4H03_07290 [Myxococcales bacterium]|nr:MAG: hypothetical protein E4H03_07290 [Myxococcales bacterium]
MDTTARLRSLLAAPSPDATEIADQLDRLPSREAVTVGRSLGGRRIQRLLWDCSATNDPISVTDLLPADYEPMKPVRYYGKNSLPAFSVFEKICCRPPNDRIGPILWGYNETRIRPLIGPGYFVVHDTKGNSFGGAAFDYTALPD